MRKRFELLCAALLALIIAACPLAAAEESAAANVLAVVNGVEITNEQALAEYEYYYAYYLEMGADDEALAALAGEIVDSYVTLELMRQNGEKLGFYPLSEEKLAEIEADASEQYETMIGYYKEYFTSEGATEEQIRENVVSFFDSQGYTLEALTDSGSVSALMTCVYEYASADATLTDEAIEAYYDERVAADREAYEGDALAFEDAAYYGMDVAFVPEGVRAVKHILILLTDDEMTAVSEFEASKSDIAEQLTREDADKEALEAQLAAVEAELDQLYAQAEETAAAIIARLEAGEDFEALLDEFGEDSGMQAEPFATRGYYVSAGSVNFEFADAAMALAAPGDVSEPVRAPYGVHIVRYERELPAGPVPIDDIRETIEDGARSQMEEAAYIALLEKWREAADIEIHLEALSLG